MKTFRFLPFLLIILISCFIQKAGETPAFSSPPPGPEAPIDPGQLPIPKDDRVPVGMLLDTNDGVKFYFDGQFRLTLPGKTAVIYDEERALHLELKPLGNAAAAPFYFAVKLLGPTQIQLEIGDFDTTQYELTSTLEAEENGTEETLNLKPGDKILYDGFSMEGQIFAGTGTPAEGEEPVSTIPFNRTNVIYMVEKIGELTVETFKRPEVFIPHQDVYELAQPTPEPTPPVGPGSGNPPPLGSGNPSLNGPSGDTGIPPQPTGVLLSGGGGLFDCSLQGSGQAKDSGQETLLFTMSLALLSGHYLVRRRRIRRFPF